MSLPLSQQSQVILPGQRCSLKSYVFLCFLCFALISCGSANKKNGKGNTAAEIEQYNYRQALQYYEIGINHFHGKELHEAITNLEKAVALDANNFRYHHGLSLAYSSNGQLNEALDQIKESLRINPNFTEGTNLMGTLLTETGAFEEAINCFRTVLQDKAYTQPQFAYYNLGRVKQLQGRNEEAIAAYKVATQLDPKFYRVYIALGELYKEMGDFEQVLFYYQKAEPNYATDTNVLFNIGYSLFKLKRYERAKSYLAQVSILFPPPNIDKPTQDMLNVIDKLIREQQQ